MLGETRERKRRRAKSSKQKKEKTDRSLFKSPHEGTTAIRMDYGVLWIVYKKLVLNIKACTESKEMGKRERSDQEEGRRATLVSYRADFRENSRRDQDGDHK